MAKPYRLPLDTGDLRLIAGEPTPVTEFKTAEQRKTSDGKYLWLVELHTFGAGPLSGQVWPTQIAGDPPKGLGDGTDVRVRGLVATEWENEGRHGITFRADAIEPANGKASGFAPAAKQDGQG